MDRIPASAGGAPDGAFERFLTAALATIITIMFSWRLLAEEEEASGAIGSTSGLHTPFQFSKHNNKPQKENKSPLRTNLSSARANIQDIGIDLSLDENNEMNSRSSENTNEQEIFNEDIVYDRHEPVQSHLPEAQSTADDSILTLSSADDSLTSDTLTTWDEYKWEEEHGEEEPCVIKTRRNVRDFVKSPNTSLSNETESSAKHSFGPGSYNDPGYNNSVPFSQRFANFEYKDAGGDSGYIDLYPDVESDDDTSSSDDEHVYEIQVSDSDSESDDERGGGFFGVTALDTIMEEYESDVSERGDGGNDVIMGESRNDIREGAPEIGVPSIHRAVCDINKASKQNNYVGKADVTCSHLSNSDTLQNVTLNDSETEQTVQERTRKSEPEVNVICQSQLNQTPLEISEVDKFEQNIPREVSDSKTSHNINASVVSPNVTTCDLNINEVKTENSNLMQNCVNLRPVDTNVVISHTKKDTVLKETSRESKQKSSRSKDTMKMKLSSDDYKISEISDDSLPPSPVRTCALDNLTEEPFSDTESCGSGSVITVISVKSNDSDNYCESRETSKQNSRSNTQVLNADLAVGKDDLSSLVSDQNTEYENFSLVSGFLNDSLNSLLSGNTGSIENSDNESSSGKENIEKDSDIQTANVTLNGKLTSDESSVSSAESLPGVGEVILTNAQISENGHIDSQDSLNSSGSANFNEEIVHEVNQPIYGQNADSEVPVDEPTYALREYDPHEDDLADYQFNFDSDDDSFFLVIDDRASDSDEEGRLRNFETFSNLNSVGLSPEYSDAVSSRTLSDDARGFRFSHTEVVSTDFKKRSYFTERSNLSDSESASSVNSETEKTKLSDITELFESEMHEQCLESYESEGLVQSSALPKSATYADADLSKNQEALNEDDGEAQCEKIDFKKYIIHSELEHVSENVELPVNCDDSTLSEVPYPIDNNNLIQDSDQNSVIDSSGDKMNTYSENGLNNLQALDGAEETFSSLTEKIERLTKNDTSEFMDSGLNKDNVDSGSKPDSNQSIRKHEKDVESLNKNVAVPNTVLSQRTQSRVETNIDDILNEVTTPNAVPNKVHVTPTKSKIETNIDDLFTENVRTTEVPVHSTPYKEQWKQSHETNIDDIFDEVKSKESNKQTIPQKSSLGKTDTSENEDKSLTSKHAEISNNDRLSYETFVEDLFDKLDPHCSSQLQTASKNLSSKGAIPENTCGGTLKSPSRDSHSRVCPKGVQPENSHISDNTELNNKLSIELGKFSEALREDIVHEEKIGLNDKEYDSDFDKIEFESNVSKHKGTPTRHEIGTNYRKTNEELKKSNNYEEELVDFGDNDLPNASTIENEDKQKRSECYSKVTEKTKNKSAPLNVDINNRQQLHGNLNIRESEFKDHNANVSLPKSETFNISKNNTSAGPSPKTDSRYVNVQSDISVKSQPSSICVQNDIGTVEHVVQTGLKIDDSLLKSEEECDVSDVELKIVEENDRDISQQDELRDENLNSIGSCSLASDDESLNSIEESYNSLQESYNLSSPRGLSESSAGRIIRAPATKPSDIFAKQKDLKGVKRQVHRRQFKKYTSVLQSPVTPERVNIVFESPHKPPSVSRLKVLKSRERFLSAENLSAGSFEDKFLQHRTSFAPTPRKYLKRHERHLQSTESLPSDMLAWNTNYGSNMSIEGMHSLPSPRQFEELYSSRYSSANTSYERAELHKLHENCMFTPEKREEIRHTTKSLENMFEQLLRYGSISSLATETDIDADVNDDVNAHAQSLQDTYYLSFQYPLERAASMSAITGPSESHKLPRKHGKGRFASRHVPKSKSLQTLETNLDDVFAAESDQPGKLIRTPSEHELRVSKSLSKLNVPDWFKKSSFSRSDSTQSLFTYAGRTGSTSTIGSSAYPPSLTTSPCPSVTPGSNTVIIQKRVTPTTMSPAAKLVRAPMLPTTPERAPIHNTSSLPSDKFRRQEKKDQLKPIAIVPFAKLREMFEKKSQANVQTVSPVTSPTKEKPKVRFEEDVNAVINDIFSESKPVQNERTISPPPPLPERKPIISESGKTSESAPIIKKTQQVHFSDENHVSNRSQEPVMNSKSQNGTKSGTVSSSKPSKKPQSLRASLPMPQFRFRRPGSYAKHNTGSQSSSSQSKKETTV